MANDIEKETIQISYGGDALKDGSMDIIEFAPVLIALDDLFDETNKYMTHGGDKITLKIKSEIKKGSFEFSIEIIKSTYQQLIDTFSGKEITALANILSILGLSAFGLIQLIKKSKGEKPINIIHIDNSVKIEFMNQQSIIVDKSVNDIFNNPRARDAVVRIVQPLGKRGFDNINFKYRGKQTASIKKDEANYFKPLIEQGKDVISEEERIFHIVSLSFMEGNKWRLSDGKTTIYVSILDDDFLRKIKIGEILFGNNDYIKVKLRIRQWYEGNDLKANYEIVKVLKHSNNPQSTFPFNQTNNDTK